jgi:stage II sporulation protein D
MVMSSSTHIGPGRRSGRRLVIVVALLAVTATSALVSVPARADPGSSVQAASFTVSGAGYGHGRGMSQYGAYGAAKRGLSWRQILTFYYPGTQQVKQGTRATIKVWITADSDNDLRVMPAKGLRLSDGAGRNYTLPTGSAYTAWRVKRSGSGNTLSYRKASGAWATKKTPLKSGAWWFSNSANVVKVWVSSGARRELRGRVGMVHWRSGGRTVNLLRMEDYLRGVVPAEMPTSWAADAVRAQSVAARSYAARLQASSRSSLYDLCDTTRCQVYRGYASTSRGRRVVYETARGNAAVAATARTILRHGRSIALTEFASSNGGSTVRTSLPYQVAKLDRYDGVIRSNAWTRGLSASSIARAYPAAGSVKQLRVTKRTGTGRWGGRVLSMKIVGSKRTLTVTGSAFQSKFGMRSSLFTIR